VVVTDRYDSNFGNVELASDRRVVFNEDGIFRRYKALDR